MHPQPSGFINAFLKLALGEVKSLADPRYTSLVDSTVRMPGPPDEVRKVVGSHTPMPTESSKGQAQQALNASASVGAGVKTHTIEGIN